MSEEEIKAALSLDIIFSGGMAYSMTEVVLKWNDEIISTIIIDDHDHDD